MAIVFHGLKQLSNKEIRYLRFEKGTKRGWYRYEGYYDYQYLILSYFLTDEIGSTTAHMIEWITNPGLIYFDGNITFMEKQSNGNIRIDFDPCMHLHEEEKEFMRRTFGVSEVKEEFIISPESLIHIIQQWMSCINFGYDEVWIKNDRGIFWVEGVR